MHAEVSVEGEDQESDPGTTRPVIFLVAIGQLGELRHRVTGAGDHRREEPGPDFRPARRYAGARSDQRAVCRTSKI